MTTGPRIGVTRWADVPPEARDRYWARVREAGGIVVDLDESAAGRVAELSPALDGLMLTGGIDVDPACYGAEPHAKVKETARDRDLMELSYLDAALERDIPVLAICRGHQLMNVGFGGTLVQHIESGNHRADFRTEGYPSRWHDVRVLAGTRVAAAFGGETAFETNSRHHQGVRTAALGPGLRAAGFADDHGGELVEAAESQQHRWCVSVQWHPERPEEQRPEFAPLMRRLFADFVSRCQ
ncbi:MAG: gamma-glutamyl-gamma-aminobutyrate hydrolase family protein [Chloroflexota bacterium]|nr:gamma-glutamyl-gamma-aminobutyrate hydrolase family protein [Chloroflexota bacterium]